MMDAETSGVGSSVQRDEEISKVLRADDLNKSITSEVKMNESLKHQQEMSRMQADESRDQNKTDGYIYEDVRKDGHSFSDYQFVNKAKDKNHQHADGLEDGRADGAKAEDQRPSARDQDMNIILESLNETQSQLNDQNSARSG